MVNNMNHNNFNNLDAGMYVVRGDNVKRITESDEFNIFNRENSEPEQLAATVSWVFIALNKRKTQIGELFRYSQWHDRNKNEIDEPPFTFNALQEFKRIDHALQITSQAYLLKQRKGKKLVGLRWLDPSTVEPDVNSAITIPGGVRFTRYFRRVNGERIPIDGNDIIHFIIPGQSEHAPGTPVSVATKLAARILYGMEQVFDTFYANNALPIMLVTVPPGTNEADKKTLKDNLWRIFNIKGRNKENRTVAVREGVTIEKLSIDPESMDASTLEESKIKAIVTAHDVPYEIIAESANYAVSQDRRREFVGNIGQRLAEIGAIINNDPDVKATGVSWVCNVEQHWSMKSDEKEIANAFTAYLQGMTPWAAAYLLGIKENDFPQDVKDRGIWREPTSTTIITKGH